VNRRLLISVVVVMLGVTAWYCWQLLNRATPEVPMPNPNGAHPLVAEAIRRAVENVRDDPESAEHWGNYGTLLFAHEYYPEAVHCFQVASDLAPDDFRWPYYRAYIDENLDLQAAHAAYLEAVRRNPRYAPARVRLARVQLRLNRTEDARRQLQAALETDPHAPFVQVELARFEVLHGDLARARDLLLAAVNTGGWDPRPAFLELSKVQMRLGDPAAAFSAQEQAARLPETGFPQIPDQIIMQAELQEVLSKGLAQLGQVYMANAQWDLASEAFRTVVNERPDSPEPLLDLALCLRMQGRYTDAIESLNLVCERFPSDVRGRFALGLVLEQSGKTEQAITAYRDALQLKPDFASAFYNLGVIFQEQGRVAEACEAFRSAIAADPQHVPSHLALGLLLQGQGQLDESIEWLERTVQLAPDNALAVQSLNAARTAAQQDVPSPGNDLP
jgi:tetratricopeptide (TPR) repeat protein